MIHLRADINSVAHASRFCSALIDTYPPTSTQTRGSRSVLAPIRDASMPKLSGRYPEAVLKLSATGGRSCPGQLADRVGGPSLPERVSPLACCADLRGAQDGSVRGFGEALRADSFVTVNTRSEEWR